LSADFVVDILVDELGLLFALVFSPPVLFRWALIFRIFRRIHGVSAFAFGIPRDVHGIGSWHSATRKKEEGRRGKELEIDILLYLSVENCGLKIYLD
jgi:hypothetical protein